MNLASSLKKVLYVLYRIPSRVSDSLDAYRKGRRCVVDPTAQLHRKSRIENHQSRGGIASAPIHRSWRTSSHPAMVAGSPSGAITSSAREQTSGQPRKAPLSPANPGKPLGVLLPVEWRYCFLLQSLATRGGRSLGGLSDAMSIWVGGE